MNAYAKAQQLGLIGSDTEIIGVLRTLTARSIELWQLREYFRQTQILVRGRNGWSGPLAAVELPVIDLLIDALDDPRQTTIDSDKPTWGPVFYAGLASLVPDLLTAEQMTAVLELGGGLPFADLTEQDFAEQKQAWEALQEVINAAKEIAQTKHRLTRRADRVFTEIKSRIALGSITDVSQFANVIDEVE